MGDERIKNPISGFENHLVVLLQNLAKNNVDVELILNYSHPGPIFHETVKKLESAGVKITCFFRRDDFQLPKNLIQKYKYHLASLSKVSTLFRKRRERIFHFHLDLVLIPLVAIISGIPKIVLSVHNDEPFFLSRSFKLWFKLIQLLRPGIRFIAITDHVRNHMIKAGIRPDRITLIYYGVPITPQKPKVKYFDNNNITIGTIGRLTAQKNIPILLEAVASIENINLVIMGEGELYYQLVWMAGDLKITDRVKFIGYVKDAGQYISSFDIFCLSSDWEGLGIVLIEAMYAKTLIVGSNAGAIPEVLGDGKYGLLFEKGNSFALRKQLKNAILSIEKNTMVESAFEFSCNTFTIDNMVHNTIEVYKKWN